MSDIYPPQTLPELLADLTGLVRKQIAAGRAMSLDSLAGFHAKLRDAHRMALEGDLIDHAKTGEIGPAIGPRMGELIDLREALASEQREVQAALDAEQADAFIDLTRPENAAVVSFPGMTHQPVATADPLAKGRAEAAHRRGQGQGSVTPFLGVRYQPHDGGDAA